MVAGTLLKEVQAGNELHLVCLTNGGGGTNPDNVPNLGEVRLNEWRAAGKLLGATEMYHLGLTDGKLNNTDMLQVATQIEAIVQNVISTHDEMIEIEFIAFDLNGLTGHIDHIAASRSAALAFSRSKATDARFTRLRLLCLPRDLFPSANIDWLYMEPGRLPDEIDDIVDARELKSDILEAIHTHYSQRSDAENLITTFGDQLGMNYFVVKS